MTSFAPDVLTTVTGTAVLHGSIRDPSLIVRLPPGARHASNPALPLLDWLRALPDARFDADQAAWVVRGTGPNAQARFTEAGIRIDGLDVGEFSGVTTIDALYSPMTLLSDDERTVLVRHRFAGYEQALEMVGPAATWDKTRRLLKVPVVDVLAAGVPRPGVLWDSAAVDRAYALHAQTPLVPGLEAAAARLAAAVDRSGVEDEVRLVADGVGHYPDWWGMPPMAHQVPGALAVAAGHTLLADEPGIGKTVSALLAATVSGCRRLFVTCPPVVATHWAREVAKTGFALRDRHHGVNRSPCGALGAARSAAAASACRTGESANKMPTFSLGDAQTGPEPLRGVQGCTMTETLQTSRCKPELPELIGDCESLT
ncbi:hypothetical protein ACRQ4C_05820 [Curtobacterium sp. SP.BCp]|uniref:hypothetical protein n=1 Tax=Curtobacterium sp. SP.BCp TaxID=3435230 RepID=UPI003F731CFD